MRLSLFDPLMHFMQVAIALANMCAERYDGASLWAEKAMQGQPNYVAAARIVAADHALAGRIERARKVTALVGQLDPGCRVSNLKHIVNFPRPRSLTRYEEGLRKAGLPE